MVSKILYVVGWIAGSRTLFDSESEILNPSNNWNESNRMGVDAIISSKSSI